MPRNPTIPRYHANCSTPLLFLPDLEVRSPARVALLQYPPAPPQLQLPLFFRHRLRNSLRFFALRPHSPSGQRSLPSTAIYKSIVSTYSGLIQLFLHHPACFFRINLPLAHLHHFSHKQDRKSTRLNSSH